MKKILRAMIVGSVTLLAWGAVASPEVLAEVVVVARGSGQQISLDIGQGKLLRLSAVPAKIFIGRPEIAEVVTEVVGADESPSSNLVQLLGIGAGWTTFIAVDAADNVIADVRVTVTHNVSELEHILSHSLPQSNITVRSVGQNVVLAGTAYSASDASDALQLATGLVQNEGDSGGILNRIEIVGPNQVNLRVRIAEVSRDTVKELGFNFDVLGGAGEFMVGLATGGLNAGGIGAGSLLNLIGAGAQAGQGLGLGFRGSSTSVNALIDALEEENLINVLAEPNLTALSGEMASFLAGGEFPVPVPQADGTLSVEFRSFGVSLSFVPTILDNGRISLRVKPEVSSISSLNATDFGSFVVPTLSTRRSETTVEMSSGQSMAIAGLLSSDTNQSVSEFPGLADLPVIGALFRSTDFRNQETELVIMVTPYLVRPVSNVALADPTEGLQVPNDFDRIVMGRLYQQRAASASSAPIDGTSQGLIGPVGFILD